MFCCIFVFFSDAPIYAFSTKEKLTILSFDFALDSSVKASPQLFTKDDGTAAQSVSVNTTYIELTFATIVGDNENINYNPNQGAYTALKRQTGVAVSSFVVKGRFGRVVNAQETSLLTAVNNFRNEKLKASLPVQNADLQFLLQMWTDEQCNFLGSVALESFEYLLNKVQLRSASNLVQNGMFNSQAAAMTTFQANSGMLGEQWTTAATGYCASKNRYSVVYLQAGNIIILSLKDQNGNEQSDKKLVIEQETLSTDLVGQATTKTALPYGKYNVYYEGQKLADQWVESSITSDAYIQTITIIIEYAFQVFLMDADKSPVDGIQVVFNKDGATVCMGSSVDGTVSCASTSFNKKETFEIKTTDPNKKYKSTSGTFAFDIQQLQIVDIELQLQQVYQLKVLIQPPPGYDCPRARVLVLFGDSAIYDRTNMVCQFVIENKEEETNGLQPGRGMTIDAYATPYKPKTQGFAFQAPQSTVSFVLAVEDYIPPNPIEEEEEEEETTPEEEEEAIPEEEESEEEETKPPNKDKTGLPWWAYLLIALAAAGICVGVTLYVIYRKQKKQKKDGKKPANVTTQGPATIKINKPTLDKSIIPPVKTKLSGDDTVPLRPVRSPVQDAARRPRVKKPGYQ